MAKIFRGNKYGNRKVKTVDGVFDSMAEYRRYCELKVMEKCGSITGLKRQKRFELLKTQRDSAGNVLERPLYYIADFVYKNSETGETVIEDVKGMRTKEYIIKRKLMLYMYGYRITEIER